MRWYLAICLKISVESSIGSNTWETVTMWLNRREKLKPKLDLVIGMLPRVGKSLPAMPGTPWNFCFLGLLRDSEARESAVSESWREIWIRDALKNVIFRDIITNIYIFLFWNVSFILWKQILVTPKETSKILPLNYDLTILAVSDPNLDHWQCHWRWCVFEASLYGKLIIKRKANSILLVDISRYFSVNSVYFRQKVMELLWRQDPGLTVNIFSWNGIIVEACKENGSV